jgi:hypothetical protein
MRMVPCGQAGLDFCPLWPNLGSEREQSVGGRVRPNAFAVVFAIIKKPSL